MWELFLNGGRGGWVASSPLLPSSILPPSYRMECRHDGWILNSPFQQESDLLSWNWLNERIEGYWVPDDHVAVILDCTTYFQVSFTREWKKFLSFISSFLSLIGKFNSKGYKYQANLWVALIYSYVFRVDFVLLLGAPFYFGSPVCPWILDVRYRLCNPLLNLHWIFYNAFPRLPFSLLLVWTGMLSF